MVISTDPGPRPPDFKSVAALLTGVVSQYLCPLYLTHKTGIIFIATSWDNTWQNTERIASVTCKTKVLDCNLKCTRAHRNNQERKWGKWHNFADIQKRSLKITPCLQRWKQIP